MAERVNVLFDTTVLIDSLRSRPGTLNLLEAASSGEIGLFTSVVNVAEVYGGMRRGEEAKTRRLFGLMELLPVTVEIAEHAGTLKNEWSRIGKTLSLSDVLVAATALRHSLQLATDNRKDFPMKELRFWPQ